jgi:phage-related protein
MLPSFGEGIYVLHAVEKRSRKTAQADVELGRQRLSDVLQFRRDEAKRKGPRETGSQ